MSFQSAVIVSAACTVASYSAMKALEDTSDEDKRARFSAWLLSEGRQEAVLAMVPQLLRALSVGPVGRLGWLRLLCLTGLFASITAVLVLLWLLTRETAARVCLACADDVLGVVSDPSFWLLAGLGAAMGVPAALVAIVKSRAFIASTLYLRMPMAVLLLDLCLSAAIAVGWVAALLQWGRRLDVDQFGAYLLVALLTAVSPTLLTAVFLSYAVLARWLIRALHWNVQVSRSLLNFKEKPFQSLGLATAPLSGIVGMLVAVTLGL